MYLNSLGSHGICLCSPRLIETRVVFEFSLSTLNKKFFGGLIETRVVFEFLLIGGLPILKPSINRNKSCIWIYNNGETYGMHTD